MIIYFAGVPGGGTSGYCKREHELNPYWTHRLWTYYWMVKDKGVMKKPNNVTMFLDSGAFSAWTKNTEVNIFDYIDFIKKHEKYIDYYANLDVIGLGGKMPDEETARLTLDNQKLMESHGLNPLPVYHLHEPYDYLDYYVKNYDYICLGIAGALPGKLNEWVANSFGRHICDKKTGLPKVKVHGFAVTSLEIITKYPFYSIDSTSWITVGRNGKILVPQFNYKKNQWDYTKNAYKISVSTLSPDKSKFNDHIESGRTQTSKNQVLKYVHAKGFKLGKSEFKTVDLPYKLQKNERWAQKEKDIQNNTRLVEIIIERGLCNNYKIRDEINILFFQDLEKSLPKWPWPYFHPYENTLFN